MQEMEEIYLSPNACAAVVREIVLSCYGVVGLAGPNGISLISQLLPDVFNRQSVEVSITECGYKINVYIIAEYGTNLRAISKNICDYVKYKLLKSYGIKTDGIKVHIKGVRLSDL